MRKGQKKYHNRVLYTRVVQTKKNIFKIFAPFLIFQFKDTIFVQHLSIYSSNSQMIFAKFEMTLFFQVENWISIDVQWFSSSFYLRLYPNCAQSKAEAAFYGKKISLKIYVLEFAKPLNSNMFLKMHMVCHLRWRIDSYKDFFAL